MSIKKQLTDFQLEVLREAAQKNGALLKKTKQTNKQKKNSEYSTFSIESSMNRRCGCCFSELLTFVMLIKVICDFQAIPLNQPL